MPGRVPHACIGALLALLVLVACAGGGAPAGPGAGPDVATRAALPLSLLAPEQLAAQRCEELASYAFPSGVLPPERRGPEAYVSMLEREDEQIWRRWRRQREASGAPLADAPAPNAMLILDVPAYEDFADDGRWRGSAILLRCGLREGWSEDAPTAERAEPGRPLLPQLDPELPGDRIVNPTRIAILTYLDAPQQRISAALNRFSVDADELLVDERAYYASSGSVVRLALDTVFQEGGQIGFFADVRIKLGLPNLEEKLEFLFESEQDELLHGLDAPLSPTPGQAVSERRYFAGLQTSTAIGDWRLRPSIGIKLGSPLDGFGRLRFDRAIRVGEWLLRPSETVFWFYSSGWGETTNLLADYLLREDLLFRSDSTARWTRERELFELSQLFYLVHTLDPISTLTYQTGVLGESEPTVEALQYLVAVSYRRLIHSDYLYLDLIPQTTFRKENAFTGEHSFTLRLELFFRG